MSLRTNRVSKILRMTMPYGLGKRQAKRVTRKAARGLPARLVKRIINEAYAYVATN